MAKRISPVTHSTLYSAARGKLPSPACGPITISRFGKAVDQDAEKGLRPVVPLVLQRHPVDAADVDAVEGAGDRVETRSRR